MECSFQHFSVQCELAFEMNRFARRSGLFQKFMTLKL